ncbi:MAG TPA: DUF3667 domain-containing protein [Rhodospirillales bacterium]|nr:DUF3667 domain-containing protein [Rhodospirillales bacterium]
MLCFSPGVLTKEYTIGKRKQFVKPITIFITANIIFFLIQPLGNINTFNTKLSQQLYEGIPYSGMART